MLRANAVLRSFHVVYRMPGEVVPRLEHFRDFSEEGVKLRLPPGAYDIQFVRTESVQKRGDLDGR